ncbi:MAG: DNA recombination protein RmuC [Bacteroidales bacterium]|nr:DNA recombination protein RmuC [Bacteroidales bacterium]
MEIYLIILSALLLAGCIWAFAFALPKARKSAREAEQAASELRTQLATKEAELRSSEMLREELRKEYDRNLKEMKENQAKTLEATKAQLTLENDKILKEREATLKREAEETMKNITGGLNKDIKEMKEAFEAQKKVHTEESSSIKTKFEETVKNLRQQAESIGSQATDLANALKGKNKMQGIFGETMLENILLAENLQKGRDYDTEFWLRDKKGNLIHNEDTGKTMRPDFALHFPDGTDIIIDSKVSLTALADYFAAETDEEREEASQRNLKSVLDHVAELNDKEYQKYLQGRKTLDYVLMFIPNYGAYQLAKLADPDIFSKAFKRNVLITTEETLIPFLRLIRSAWVQKETLQNINAITEAARKMLDRVATFSAASATVEDQFRRVLKGLEENNQRLVSGRQSIAKAAREVIQLGVSASAGKTLPEPAELPGTEDSVEE